MYTFVYHIFFPNLKKKLRMNLILKGDGFTMDFSLNSYWENALNCAKN